MWAFDPTLDAFTREVCQNTLDVREGPVVHLDFGLYRLTSADLEVLLPASRWFRLSDHLRASAEPSQI